MCCTVQYWIHMDYFLWYTAVKDGFLFLFRCFLIWYMFAWTWIDYDLVWIPAFTELWIHLSFTELELVYIYILVFETGVLFKLGLVWVLGFKMEFHLILGTHCNSVEISTLNGVLIFEFWMVLNSRKPEFKNSI